MVLLLAWSTARAAPPRRPDDFDREVAAAERLYTAQDYAGAIRQLEAAYQRKPVVRLLFNLGMAHRKLGQVREALDYFERYRAARSAADQQVPIDDYIDQLRTQLAEHDRMTAPAAAPNEAESPVPTVAAAVAPPPPPVASTPATQPADSVNKASAAPPRHRRVWLWSGLAAAVVVGVGLGVGLGLGLRPTHSLSPTLSDIGPGTRSALIAVQW